METKLRFFAFIYLLVLKGKHIDSLRKYNILCYSLFSFPVYYKNSSKIKESTDTLNIQNIFLTKKFSNGVFF